MKRQILEHIDAINHHLQQLAALLPDDDLTPLPNHYPAPQLPPPPLGVSTSPIFGFGKHKDESVEEVQQTDPQYISWIKHQDWLEDKAPDIYNYIFKEEYNDEDIDDYLPPLELPF